MNTRFTQHKPYLKAGTITEVAEGELPNQPARIERFKSCRFASENGVTKVFETWQCAISMPNDPREFNLSKDKEFEISEQDLKDRREFLDKTPERFERACEEAQTFANDRAEPVALWESELGLFFSRELRFTEQGVEVILVLYPLENSKPKRKRDE